jgi:hypothetical protein
LRGDPQVIRETFLAGAEDVDCAFDGLHAASKA